MPRVQVLRSYLLEIGHRTLDHHLNSLKTIQTPKKDEVATSRAKISRLIGRNWGSDRNAAFLQLPESSLPSFPPPLFFLCPPRQFYPSSMEPTPVFC